MRGLSPHVRSLRDLYPLTRNPRYARIPTSPRKRGEVNKSHPEIRASATAFLNSAFIASEMPWVGLTSK